MSTKIKNFIEELAVAEVTANVYNQYAYICKENAVRRENLYIYLRHMHKQKPKIILVGEAPGYRGCRLTGVPFTSEHLLVNGMEGLALFGEKAGYRLAAHKDKVLIEATATILWETLLKNNIIPLAWNAFPFHPHLEGKPESNRTPIKGELRIGERPLLQMIEMFNIKRVVAVGNKAEETLTRLGMSCHKVRHPAQGGKNEFVEGIRKIVEAGQNDRL